MKTVVRLLILLFFSNTSFTQKYYHIADSIVQEVSKKEFVSIDNLVSDLTKNLSSDLQKFRVIHHWIAINIKYDLDAKSNEPNNVFKSKKAICSGFSFLLQDMCEKVYIPCKYVTGYIKTTISDLDKIEKVHAWNIVKIGDEWIQSDVTWASSKKKQDSIYSKYDDDYFIMAPELFELKHWAFKKEQRMTDQSLKEFKKSPIYYPNYYDTQDRVYPITCISAKNNYKGCVIFIEESAYTNSDSVNIEVRQKGKRKKIVQPLKKEVTDSGYNLFFDLSFIRNKSKVILTYNDKDLIGCYWK